MNQTETKALKWLSGKFGIEPEKIIYHATTNPDFLLPNKQAFEVKRLYSDQILFYPNQLEKLQNFPGCKVLVFDGGATPIAIIPIEDILAKPTHWQNIKLNFVKGIAGIFIRLTEEDKQAVGKDAQKLGLSVTAFMRLLYKQWSDGIRFERNKGHE